VLGHGKSSPYYPKDMPANLAELEEWWEAMDDKAKRLLISSPEENYWNYIYENFDNAFHINTLALQSMGDLFYDPCLDPLLSFFNS
jgi:hypothetical protein